MPLLSIGERLRAIREISGCKNQTEFGQKIGLSQTMIGLYENNNRPIPDRAIMQICTTFNVNENWLKTGNGEMFLPTISNFLNDPTLDEIDRAILTSYIRLTPSQRAVIKEYIKEVSGQMQIKSEILQNSTNDVNPSIIENPAKRKMSTEAKRAIIDAELQSEERVKMS